MQHTGNKISVVGNSCSQVVQEALCTIEGRVLSEQSSDHVLVPLHYKLKDKMAKSERCRVAPVLVLLHYKLLGAEALLSSSAH